MWAKEIILSAFISVLLALGASSYSWTERATRYEVELQQTKEAVTDIRDLTKQMATMNNNMVEIQTELKYYRRDIDELRKAQDDISSRIDTMSK